MSKMLMGACIALLAASPPALAQDFKVKPIRTAMTRDTTMAIGVDRGVARDSRHALLVVCLIVLVLQFVIAQIANLFEFHFLAPGSWLSAFSFILLMHRSSTHREKSWKLEASG